MMPHDFTVSLAIGSGKVRPFSGGAELHRRLFRSVTESRWGGSMTPVDSAIILHGAGNITNHA